MMARRKSPMGRRQEELVEEDWIVTYADAITLLMAFFVMLVSFSKVEIPLFEKVQSGIAEQIGKREIVRPTQVLETDLKDVVFNTSMDNAVNVSTDDEGILMELGGGAFFHPGSANLTQDAVLFLKDVGDLLKEPRYLGFQVEVTTPRFPSNWELAAGRSIAVVRFLSAVGVDPESDRMRAISYGDTKPKLPNRGDDGNPIEENREANRRIEIRIFPKYSRVF
jgi:chemotaxis protein MotB